MPEKEQHELFICGHCGTPTDKEGMPLPQQAEDPGQGTDSAIEPTLVNGYCCYDQEPDYMQVTRDMALDAGDSSLEGQLIER